MGRTSTVSSTKEKLSKGQIAKIATSAAKEAVKKSTKKTAREEAAKVAKKVANATALNPDYSASIEEDEFETEDDDGMGIFGSFANSQDEDEDDDSSGYGLLGGNDDEEEEEDDDSDVRSQDIFSYAKDLVQKGTPIRFTIKKNGQFLTTLRKPYSEEELQRDHGEGHYHVILRNDVKGTYIKQQSFAIAAPSVNPVEVQVKAQQEKQEEKIDRMFETFATMSERQAAANAELYEKLMEEQRRREEEEKERRREERELLKDQEKNNMNVLATVLQASLNKKDDGGSLATLLQVMQNQQNQTTQMIMESNKNFMMMMQESRKDTASMIEKMTQMQQEQAREFRQQLQEMSKAKSNDGFDPITMFKMLNDTREAGMNFGLKINELAKQVAENDITPAQPKGIVESVLDNLGKLAPIMYAASQQGGGQSAAQHFHQAPAQSLPAPQAPEQGLRPTGRAPSYKAQPAPAPVVKAPTGPVTVAKTAPVNQTQGTGTQKNPTKKPSNTGVKKTEGKTAVASTTEGGKIDTDAELKTRVIDLCVPLIGHALTNQIPSGKLGDASINAFNSQGISLTTAMRLLTLEDIYELSFKKYGLPDVPELRAYLKDYHDYLSQKASA